ncbi:MAG: hypothetical protein ACHQ53_11575 [Polyangiales bacterium]
MPQLPKALMLALLALPGGLIVTPALWLWQRHASRRHAASGTTQAPA